MTSRAISSFKSLLYQLSPLMAGMLHGADTLEDTNILLP